MGEAEEAPPELKSGDAGDLRATLRFLLVSYQQNASSTFIRKAFDAMQAYEASDMLADEQRAGSKVGSLRTRSRMGLHQEQARSEAP